MSIVLDGTSGITTPEIVSTGGPLVVNASAPDNSVVVDASGNVGIGTDSPIRPLEVNGILRIDGNSFSEISNNASEGREILQLRAKTLLANGAGINLHGDEDSATPGIINFFTSGSARARIDLSGNLLVGTTSGAFSERLTVVNTNATASFFSTNIATEFGVAIRNTATSGNNGFLLFQTEAGGTTRGSITFNRGSGVTAYNTTSDYRAKDIIGPVADSGAVIDSVPVYMGKMKGATQERPMFIAHEVPAYAHTGEKDAVDAEGKPVYQQMDAIALIPVMWAELQSLRARVASVEELKTINDAQAQTIESLTARVVALEQA